MPPEDTAGDHGTGFDTFVREHGRKIALAGFGLVLVSTRILSRDGHTPLSVLLIAVGVMALVAPFVVPRLWEYREETP